MRIVIGATFFLAAAAFGQVPATNLPVVTANANPATNLPMQRLGPEDLITMPMVRQTIKVQGLFPSEAEKVIADVLKTENLLNDPFVTVAVAEYKSRPVNVVGAVKSPTIFQAVGSVSLLDALSRAGGVADNAGPTVVITRPNGSSDAQLVQRIPVKLLMQGNDPELNLKLIGGEEIRVPIVDTVIVQGNVVHPGVFPVLDPISMNTVISAIAQAQGLSQYADHKAYIFRVDEQGVKHTINVPLWDILQRKKPDVILQARDTLYIPDSPKRRITQTTISTMTGLGSSAATAAIYVAR
jgi:polysaccharide export outer membrane protein